MAETVCAEVLYQSSAKQAVSSDQQLRSVSLSCQCRVGDAAKSSQTCCRLHVGLSGSGCSAETDLLTALGRICRQFHEGPAGSVSAAVSDLLPVQTGEEP